MIDCFGFVLTLLRAELGVVKVWGVMGLMGVVGFEFSGECKEPLLSRLCVRG